MNVMNSNLYFDQAAQTWDNMRAGFFSEAVRAKALAVAGIEKNNQESLYAQNI